jgi:hypothetical protein
MLPPTMLGWHDADSRRAHCHRAAVQADLAEVFFSVRRNNVARKELFLLIVW